MADDLLTRSEEVVKERTGKELVQEKDKKGILDEAKQINEQLIESLRQLKETKEEMEKSAAFMMMGGKSFAGVAPKETTQEDLDNLEADKYLRAVGLKK